jgi:phage terminase small subunit
MWVSFIIHEKEGCLMTPKQEAFAIEYLKDKNATQAAIRAGYSKKTAYSIGCEMLKRTDVQQFLRDKQEEAAKNATITVESIAENLREIAANPLAKDSDRIRAYELLGKYLGMFTERVEMKGQIDTAVTKLDGILKQLDP